MSCVYTIRREGTWQHQWKQEAVFMGGIFVFNVIDNYCCHFIFCLRSICGANISLLTESAPSSSRNRIVYP
jgi:hypothetical protein